MYMLRGPGLLCCEAKRIHNYIPHFALFSSIPFLLPSFIHSLFTEVVFFQVRFQIGTRAMNLANIETFKRNKKHKSTSFSVRLYSGASVVAENLKQGCTKFRTTSTIPEARGSLVVKALGYKTEGRTRPWCLLSL
jgi:hypothetical protein